MLGLTIRECAQDHTELIQDLQSSPILSLACAFSNSNSRSAQLSDQAAAIDQQQHPLQLPLRLHAQARQTLLLRERDLAPSISNDRVLELFQLEKQSFCAFGPCELLKHAWVSGQRKDCRVRSLVMAGRVEDARTRMCPAPYAVPMCSPRIRDT